MSSIVPVAVHPSQFPQRVRQELLASLQHRRINHKFHYESVKQSQKWLALHQAYSPARTEADCAATYDRSFHAVAGRLGAGRVHVVGLGCGGGQKDVRLLELMAATGTEVLYSPVDVSLPLVLTAQQAALAVIPRSHCSPLVCDLGTAQDLPAALNELVGQTARRLFTFFGMLPNFEPDLILPRLAALMRAGDSLLVSANLAPGPDYAAGVQRILPQYDNDLTRDWLMTFLLDLGVEQRNGEIRFLVEDEAVRGGTLKRIVAHFHFARACEIRLDDHQFAFGAGETMRLFFSYRHTPALVRSLLAESGLGVGDEWVTTSGEEGLFLVNLLSSKAP